MWTDGFQLEACGPGVAWCVAWPWVGWEPREGDRPWLDRWRLLRIDRDGHPTPVGTHGRIERVKAGRDALHVQLTVPPNEGPGSGINPPTDWVSLRWDAEVPGTLVPPTGLLRPPFDAKMCGTSEEDPGPTRGVQEGEEPDWNSWENPPWDRVGRRGPSLSLQRAPPSGVTTNNHCWSVGSIQESPPPASFRRRLQATAHTPDGSEVQRWNLGRGDVLSAIPLGDRLAVTVVRPGGTSEVLMLDPDAGEVTVLLATDAVDITDLGWPTVTQPVHADSYVTQVRAQWSRLSFGEGRLFDEHATLLGQWPDTQLEWTFRWTTRPGLILRRRVPLFDQLGRIAYPEDATLDLMETVESGLIPPADDAVNGYLDL